MKAVTLGDVVNLMKRSRERKRMLSGPFKERFSRVFQENYKKLLETIAGDLGCTVEELRSKYGNREIPAETPLQEESLIKFKELEAWMHKGGTTMVKVPD